MEPISDDLLAYCCPKRAGLRFKSVAACQMRRDLAVQPWPYEWEQPAFDECLDCQGPVPAQAAAANGSE